jgi:hypothetical protein
MKILILGSVTTNSVLDLFRRDTIYAHIYMYIYIIFNYLYIYTIMYVCMELKWNLYKYMNDDWYISGSVTTNSFLDLLGHNIYLCTHIYVYIHNIKYLYVYIYIYIYIYILIPIYIYILGSVTTNSVLDLLGQDKGASKYTDILRKILKQMPTNNDSKVATCIYVSINEYVYI